MTRAGTWPGASPEGQRVPKDALAQIISEAAGHPLFLQRLIQFTTAQLSLDRAGAPGAGRFELPKLLRLRIDALPPPAREALEFLCIASQPMSPLVLFVAVESSDVDQRAEVVAMLVRETFVRHTGSDIKRGLAPYHDDVRTTVVGLLTPERRRALHARLANVFAMLPETEPQILVHHFQQAGDQHAAFDASLRAAHFAEDQLAFDRAAVFYDAALKARPTAPLQRAELLRERGRALSMTGRGHEAAADYLQASTLVQASQRTELERRATDQLMRSGHVSEALAKGCCKTQFFSLSPVRP
jgi:eukaryotic-like serine/threonine-protein kinase